MKMSNSVTLETTAKACIVVDVGSDITSSHSGPTKGLAATLTSLAIEEVGEGKEDPKMMMMKMDGGPAPHHRPAASQPRGLPPGEEEGRGAEDRGCRNSTEKEVKSPRKTLSRDSSQDYTDSTGIDLHEFLVNTLTNNPRDRITLLKLEQDLLDFIRNNESQRRKFPPMTSYHRMLLHRVAAYFGLEHNVDPSGKSVVVNKTTSTRIPEQKLCDYIQDEVRSDEGFSGRHVLKRDHRSFDDASQVRMRLKSDMRSKSMEEREEEYQRARDWIYEGDHLIFSSRSQEKETGKSSQQRRQLFSRQQSGCSGAGCQSSSEMEASRPSDRPPWSSSDSSESSQRPPPPPPSGGPPAPPAWVGAGVTRPSGLSGCVPGTVMVHGDSTASSKSTGRLSQTGSDSSSSVVSCSLSRPLVAQPPTRAHPTCVCPSQRHGNARGPKSNPVEGVALASFYVLPFESAAAGMMPASILVNVHTGQPILVPDDSVTMHGAPGPASTTGRGQQPLRHPPAQPIHLVTQQQPPIQLHTQADALSAHFGHMILMMRQPPEGGGVVGMVQSPQDSHHCQPPLPYHLYHQAQHPHTLRNTSHPLASYLVAGALPGAPPSPTQNAASLYHHHHQQNHQQPYPCPSTPGPGGFQAVMSQSVLQQHSYIQPPVQQVNSYYCASTHYAQPTNQQQPYQAPPNTPLTAYSCPQHQAYNTSASLPSAAPGYQSASAAGLQPISSQQSSVENQMQGVMVHYPAMPTYQMPMSHTPQAVPQHSYGPQQQPLMISCQLTQGGVAMQPCYGLLPPGQQHTTMSSTVSFLPVQVVEPLQYQPPPTTSLPQHCTGVYPGPPGDTGMVVMQLPAQPPPYQPPPRAPSPYQRKPPGYKLHGVDQQLPRRSSEGLQPPDNPQSSVRLGSRTWTLSALLGHPGAIQGPHLALPTMPFKAHLHPQHLPHQHPLPTAFYPGGQGEACCPLVAMPLHNKPLLQPPLLHIAPVGTIHQKGRHPHHRHPTSPKGPWGLGRGRLLERFSSLRISAEMWTVDNP
ncbi:R3H domain-containing protein 1 isoform X2 [Gadus morhua]|uniref:R3H domain-containing protein 1 isoform X2 n=1 Tax=Gadus morhua TaxID=8049 RepID=UPI0011B49737|nr:R3H domain-containing protein 1-like isoform X2 [Gadus morhua]